MIALDTNVLVRYLAQDDAEQFKIAAELIGGCTAEAPGYICREVMIELVWVLERAYKYTRHEISAALLGLVSASELVVETADDVAAIVHLYQSEGFGFADLMIRQAAIRRGVPVLKTFDQKLAKLSAVDLLGATH